MALHPPPPIEIQRIHLRVRGIVQGVGFRPYVYNLARRHNLAGFVLNSPNGVVIEIEGPQSALEKFIIALRAEAPPLVEIAELAPTSIAPLGETEFIIRRSSEGEATFTLIPPDICVCDQCLVDIYDSNNRRYEYPFTNCTNCGPRYSLIRDIPYDRRFTTMSVFEMCDNCRREYEDPSNRRFHAQPNACPVCGPHMYLAQPHQPAENAVRPAASAREILTLVANNLLAGGIVAWKGLGGYQLACDARNDLAVQQLRTRKHRSEKPFAVMVRDLAAAERICAVSTAEAAVLTGRERPIVLLATRHDSNLAPSVSPGSNITGVMLPSTPMHDLLFRIVAEQAGEDVPLIMTSGNISEEPIVITEPEAAERLSEIADLFVHHNRGIHTRVDDSVVRFLDDAPMVFRRARGYAPQPIFLNRGDAEVLACGAQLKSTLCLIKAGFALPSQHLGDLENYETLRFFEETLDRMRKLFHVTPQAVAYDLHPGYLSTQFAMRLDIPRRIGVQHHHAHIASCMAEHQLDGQVIGVAWDGTGFGTDGTIWGGEFLAAGYAGFTRFAHLRTVLLAGGDAAVREPWRLARSYLRDAFDNAIPTGVPFGLSQPAEKVRLVDAMLQQGISTMQTSSCGRLFDAVASLIGLRHTVSYEGQAAMAVESAASNFPLELSDRYQFSIPASANAPAQIDLRPMVRQIVAEVSNHAAAGQIAARFHNTLVEVVAEVCRRMRNQLSLSRVCLSGGCFQNVRLLRGCANQLRADGFEVFSHSKIPANDGGISLGQAAIACELIRQGA